mmetsp:Transcript_46606/g.113535  ORF Transcript_46606/g.113535 Transcript_46606/m.113535 type:complete len:918 (+) Transcript_46606:218-2971(+)
MTTNSNSNSNSSSPMQGVLWKRRDVFKSRWRPRWFVLHPDRHILTYYLLTNQGGDSGGSGPQQLTSSRFRSSRTRTNRSSGATTGSNNSNNDVINHSNSTGGGAATTAMRPDGLDSFTSANRRRTFSETSNVSESTLDYDVIPRGTIYLLNATVEKNPSLTRPDEELFVLTITDKQDGTSNNIQCHLAARSEEARDQWIHQIRNVCQPMPTAEYQRRRHARQRRTRGADTPNPRDQQHHRHQDPNSRPLQNRRYQEQQQQEQEQNPLDEFARHRTPPRSNLRGNIARSLSPHPLTEVVVRDGDAPRNTSSPGQVGSNSQSGLLSAQQSIKNEWTAVPCPETASGGNIPSNVSKEIDDVLQRYLPYVDDEDHPDFKLRYNKNGIHCSVHKEQPALIRSIRRETKHHPVEYLQVLWDLQQADGYETNLKTQELIRQLNNQTAFVYQSYHAVWPTAPRDFTVVAHWRLLQQRRRTGNQRTGTDADHKDDVEYALCLVTFSSQAADELMPVDDRHVRGTLVVGLHFWRLNDDSKTSKGRGRDISCSYTRIISYNLNGNIPSQITKAVLEQQAALPRILDLYLEKKKQDSSYTVFNHQMDYDRVIQDLKKMTIQSSGSSSSKKFGDRSESMAVSSRNATTKKDLRSHLPIGQDALLLLGPLVITKMLSLFSIYLPVIVLPIWTILLLRWLALRHIQSIMQEVPSNMIGNSMTSTMSPRKGTTCCRFSVDLKGVMRFLENEKEAKAHLGRVGSEVELAHCIVAALAKGIGKSPHLFSRRVLPTTSRCFYSFDIAVHDDYTPNGNIKIIRNADGKTVQDLADFFSSGRDPHSDSTFHKLLLGKALGPSCRLFMAPHSDHTEVDVDVSMDDCPVTCCISALRSQKGQKSPLIHVGINIQSTDVNGCREFAEEVQKNLQFPEMLEG